MIAGHLQEKNDFYYAVLNYKDSAGKRHTKWCRTGLPVKGNKKRAEAVLMELRLSFDPEAEEAARRIRKGESPALDFEMAQSEGGRLLFADYLEQWLKVARSTVKTITYSGYAEEVQKRINPWFRERGIALTELQASDIQDFYSFRLETVKATTVIHDHAVIHRALKYAVKMDMIPVNPADKVERPRKEAFQASFYDRNELNRLFEAAKGTRLEIPVMLAAFYGLRRSEVLGLRWDAIDFDNDTITIRHTVTSFNMDGKHMLIASDTTKTKSSMRTLPLVPVFRERLRTLKREQVENRRLCGRSYCPDYIGYICVDEMGNLIQPNYISTAFRKLLENNGLRSIRFHDLRHSCASMMLANGVAMKQIQEWLGHSDFSTTANIYAHLDYNSKLSSAEAMLAGLGLKCPEA